MTSPNLDCCVLSDFRYTSHNGSGSIFVVVNALEVGAVVRGGGAGQIWMNTDNSLYDITYADMRFSKGTEIVRHTIVR